MMMMGRKLLDSRDWDRFDGQTIIAVQEQVGEHQCTTSGRAPKWVCKLNQRQLLPLFHITLMSPPYNILPYLVLPVYISLIHAIVLFLFVLFFSSCAIVVFTHTPPNTQCKYSDYSIG